jgi:hypothetical protein
MVEHITFFEGFDLYVLLLMEHPHRSLTICLMDIKLYILSKAYIYIYIYIYIIKLLSFILKVGAFS